MFPQQQPRRTLVVEYLPGYPESNTKELLQQFLDALPIGEEVRRHDLLMNLPPLFSTESLRAYMKRDMLGEHVDAEELASLAPFDALVADALATDILVLAFPMHNFSLPAAVKAYFDAIMLNNGTWRYGPEPGQYTGLMAGKKALAIAAAGGVYDQSPVETWDHLSPLVRIEFGFMGFSETEVILAEGMLRRSEIKRSGLERSRGRIAAIVEQWYGAEGSAPTNSTAATGSLSGVG